MCQCQAWCWALFIGLKKRMLWSFRDLTCGLWVQGVWWGEMDGYLRQRLFSVFISPLLICTRTPDFWLGTWQCRIQIKFLNLLFTEARLCDSALANGIVMWQLLGTPLKRELAHIILFFSLPLSLWLECRFEGWNWAALLDHKVI